MKAVALAEELFRIVEEFGDVDVAMPDAFEATWRNPVDRVEYEQDREAVLLVTDR